MEVDSWDSIHESLQLGRDIELDHLNHPASHGKTLEGRCQGTLLINMTTCHGCQGLEDLFPQEIGDVNRS